MNSTPQKAPAAIEKTPVIQSRIHRETLCLAAAAREIPGNAAAHLVTRATGEAVRAKAEQALIAQSEPSVLVLDFAGAGIIDYSCADELVAKFISRLVGGEYGDRYVVLGNMNNEHKENIQVALERKELAAVAWLADNSGRLVGVSSDNPGGERADARSGIGNRKSKIENPLVLGSLNPHLRQALNLVMAAGAITAKEIAKKLGIELNTAGTRLINIHKRRLVLRTERVLSVGGREFIYSPLL